MPLFTPITPESVRPPFGRYHHAIEVRRAERLLFLSGQLAVTSDGSVPESVEAQTELILANIEAILSGAGLARGNLVRLSTFLLDPADRQAYMQVRDRWVADPAPASTLLFVKALALPECRVEIEAIAAG